MRVGGGRCRRVKRFHVVVLISVIFHCLVFLGIKDMYFRVLTVQGISDADWPEIGGVLEPLPVPDEVPLEAEPASPPLIKDPLPSIEGRRVIPPEEWEEPPAKRVVVFLADGLRLDKLTRNYSPQPAQSIAKEPVAPFLKKIVETEGALAISLAKGPTESRPAHAALLCGVFDDPGIFGEKGNWDKFLFPIDSIFNHSSHTYFYLGATQKASVHQIYRTFVKTLAHAESRLWAPVLGKSHVEWADLFGFESFLKDLFHLQRRSPTLHAGQEIFWVDLQGIDHEEWPTSFEYLDLIAYMDAQIQVAYDVFQTLFPDNRTAFLLTSDHGRHDEGWHGDESVLYIYIYIN